jgi:hypothetical protein
MYIQENLKKSSEWQDQAKIDDLKSSLWL